ncbi:hypothetical protein [Endozoicomonas numazuensis]|uniref:Uncharacterized protein n=1 Tax=Endozoicomonas numazuensis TaxID=1137799 RepID=A0A081NCW0_9GAMM|nr:hypothetical protein [Endozoicomonas numazuensis]KEQ16283.1 hypothetical protein GZ78_24060 [Endozoicomonas numazuensis]
MVDHKLFFAVISLLLSLSFSMGAQAILCPLCGKTDNPPNNDGVANCKVCKFQYKDKPKEELKETDEEEEDYDDDYLDDMSDDDEGTPLQGVSDVSDAELISPGRLTSIVSKPVVAVFASSGSDTSGGIFKSGQSVDQQVLGGLVDALTQKLASQHFSISLGASHTESSGIETCQIDSTHVDTPHIDAPQAGAGAWAMAPDLAKPTPTPEGVLYSFYENVVTPFLASNANNDVFNNVLCLAGFICLSSALSQLVQEQSSIGQQGASLAAAELAQGIGTENSRIISYLLQGDLIIEFGIQNQGTQGFGNSQAVIFYNSDLQMFVVQPYYLTQDSEAEFYTQEELLNRIYKKLAYEHQVGANVHYFLYQPKK